MVEAFRQGLPLRQAALRFEVSLSTIQRWVQRASHQRLEAVDWADRVAGPRTPANRTSRQVEDRVLS